MTVFLLLLGFVMLIVGAEVLVRGAAKVAVGVGISPLVVGLTVVAFCTSSPELSVSILSSVSGNVDIATGNVIGSNIFNVLFILGLVSLITPLFIAQQILWLDVPIMISVYLLMFVFGLNGQISQLEGVILIILFIGYNFFVVYQSRKEKKAVQIEYQAAYSSETRHDWRFWLSNIGLILIGLAMLVLGSNWLVESAVSMARQWGVSDLIIGLTVISIGTSLPEAATSVVAGIRGDRDIAVGNVIGSCIFNVLSVLGIAAAISPKGVPVLSAAIHFDIPVMIATGVACLPIFYNGHRIVRWEGAVFLGYYVAYTVYLVLIATKNEGLRSFEYAMFWFVIPLTVITLIAATTFTWRKRKKRMKQVE